MTSSNQASPTFYDRRDAGRRLAQLLLTQRDEHPIVLGLARGGVPVAAEVARILQAPLDVVVVRKLGVPGHEEYAFGAISEGGVATFNDQTTRLGLSRPAIDAVLRREEKELARRVLRYRHGDVALDLEGRNVIVVDDGWATGATARAAIETARRRSARRVIIAAPVGSTEAATELATRADEVVVLLTPPRFQAVGQWYEVFDQTGDEEVVRLLNEARETPFTS